MDALNTCTLDHAATQGYKDGRAGRDRNLSRDSSRIEWHSYNVGYRKGAQEKAEQNRKHKKEPYTFSKESEIHYARVLLAQARSERARAVGRLKSSTFFFYCLQCAANARRRAAAIVAIPESVQTALF